MDATLTIQTHVFDSAVVEITETENDTISIVCQNIVITDDSTIDATNLDLVTTSQSLDVSNSHSESSEDVELDIVSKVLSLVTSSGESTTNIELSIAEDGVGGSNPRITQTAYDAMSSHDKKVIYLVTDDNDILQNVYVGDDRILTRSASGAFTYVFPFTLA